MRKTWAEAAGALPVSGSDDGAPRNGTSDGTADTALRDSGIADSGDAARFAVEPLGAFFGMARKASERTWSFTG
jgi:hypothetical protein